MVSILLSIASLLLLSPSGAYAVCNYDDCYRNVLRVPAVASAFCTARFIDQTVTYTPSVAVTVAPTYVLPTAEPSQLKRREAIIQAINPPLPPGITPRAVPRQIFPRQVLPAQYPASCGEGPVSSSRVASVCSCIGISPVTETVSTTRTVTKTNPALPTATVCNSNQYGPGIVYGPGGVDGGQPDATISYVSQAPIKDAAQCCARCFLTPGCTNYYVYFFDVCYLTLVTFPVGVEPQAGYQIDPMCPGHKSLVAITKPEDRNTSDPTMNGLGPCFSPMD